MTDMTKSNFPQHKMTENLDLKQIELGVAKPGRNYGEVWTDFTMEAGGLLQTLKTSIHEIGHAIFGFVDNSGGVMNQNQTDNLNFTIEQRDLINEITN